MPSRAKIIPNAVPWIFYSTIKGMQLQYWLYKDVETANIKYTIKTNTMQLLFSVQSGFI